MVVSNPTSNYPKIIQSVTSIMGLSALALLAAGAAFTAVLVKTPEAEQLRTFLVMAGILLIIVFANMVYAYFMQRHELTFRVRVSRMQDGVETPCENTQVEFYKNNDIVQTSSTDDMGISAFTVTFERNDELYFVVTNPDTGVRTNRAAIYAGGQCQMIKTIRL